MKLIAVDWSGALHPDGKIWLAQVAHGALVDLRSMPSREAAVEHLKGQAKESPDLIVGLDFAFSCPAWFVKSKDCNSAGEFWDKARIEGEGWLKHKPFWSGRGERPADNLGFRVTEKRVSEAEVFKAFKLRPSSVFKLVGPDQVGKGSIRGMPFLRDLRKEGFAIWPFHNAKPPFVVEIWPRLFAPEARKNDCNWCREYLSKVRNFTLPDALRDKAASSGDAFDATVSVLYMAEHLNQLRSPEINPARETLLEGQIWYSSAR